MPTLPDHLTHIIEHLRSLLASIMPPGHRPIWEGPSLNRVLSNRIGRYAAHVARLYALWRAGRLPHPRPSRAGRPRPSPAPTPEAALPPQPRVSRAHGWLVRLGGHRVAAARAQLEVWLQRPEMVEFIAAAPQAGRHLRPLCRMLGAPLPPFLQLRPHSRRPRKPRPRGPNATPRRIALEKFDPPLQPYVIAAARAWRKKYG